MARKFYSTLEVKNEINVTPLMDIMCMLMMLFMITSPMLEYDTDISLPRLTTQHALDQHNGVTININADGKISCDFTDMASMAQLSDVLAQKLKENPKVRVLIRADGTNQLNEVFEVIRAAKKVGAVNMGLVSAGESDTLK